MWLVRLGEVLNFEVKCPYPHVASTCIWAAQGLSRISKGSAVVTHILRPMAGCGFKAAGDFLNLRLGVYLMECEKTKNNKPREQ